MVIFVGGNYAADIPLPATPTGTLNHTLGTYLRIEGVKKSGGNAGETILLVDYVNEVRLERPIPIHLKNVHPLPEKVRCIINGYESMKMIGMPAEVSLAEKARISPFPFKAFYYFVVTSVVGPSKVKIKHTL